MKLIVGLGNPGKKYANTRHNVGFMVVDLIAKQLGVIFSFVEKSQAEVASSKRNGENIFIVKPQTYMNLSGEAVGKLARFYKVDSSQITIVYDDVDLPLGQIRVRTSGSSAGHRGSQSIIDTIGEDFNRVRIGISRSPRVATKTYVLGRFEAGERTVLKKVLDAAVGVLVKSNFGPLESQTIKVE